jgi:hypothetical protein
MRRMNLLLFALYLTVQVFSQSTTDVINGYIDTYRELAISEMQRTGVPASIKLAQGILETEARKYIMMMMKGESVSENIPLQKILTKTIQIISGIRSVIQPYSISIQLIIKVGQTA